MVQSLFEQVDTSTDPNLMDNVSACVCFRREKSKPLINWDPLVSGKNAMCRTKAVISSRSSRVSRCRARRFQRARRFSVRFQVSRCGVLPAWGRVHIRTNNFKRSCDIDPQRALISHHRDGLYGPWSNRGDRKCVRHSSYSEILAKNILSTLNCMTGAWTSGSSSSKNTVKKPCYLLRFQKKSWAMVNFQIVFIYCYWSHDIHQNNSSSSLLQLRSSSRFVFISYLRHLTAQTAGYRKRQTSVHHERCSTNWNWRCCH